MLHRCVYLGLFVWFNFATSLLLKFGVAPSGCTCCVWLLCGFLGLWIRCDALILCCVTLDIRLRSVCFGLAVSDCVLL